MRVAEGLDPKCLQKVPTLAADLGSLVPLAHRDPAPQGPGPTGHSDGGFVNNF